MLELGLFLPVLEDWLGDGWLPRWPELKGLAALAEAVGFDALFVPDHLVIGPSPYWGIPEGEARGTWEAWTLLGALAAETRRVAIGTFVLGAGFRNPALLAKMAATLDEVSGGRLILGLGCGSHPPEYAAFGYPYDHRVDRFEEALGILVPLLREGRVDFTGRYHAARACELRPRGPRPAGPPIWIAAYQPRMMRLAARWGDAFVTAWHPGRGSGSGTAGSHRRRVRGGREGAGDDGPHGRRHRPARKRAAAPASGGRARRHAGGDRRRARRVGRRRRRSRRLHARSPRCGGYRALRARDRARPPRRAVSACLSSAGPGPAPFDPSGRRQ